LYNYTVKERYKFIKMTCEVHGVVIVRAMLLIQPALISLKTRKNKITRTKILYGIYSASKKLSNPNKLYQESRKSHYSLCDTFKELRLLARRGGQILAFSIDFRRRNYSYTTFALPFECVIIESTPTMRVDNIAGGLSILAARTTDVKQLQAVSSPTPVSVADVDLPVADSVRVLGVTPRHATRQP